MIQKISKNIREQIFLDIKDRCKYGVGIASESEIDQLNILNATKLAMKRSFLHLVDKFKVDIDLVLVDGNFVPQIDVPAQSVIKGDQKSLSIAAASIVAKCTRDSIMLKLSKEFPQYQWHKNQAYPTKFHLEKINEIEFVNIIVRALLR